MTKGVNKASFSGLASIWLESIESDKYTERPCVFLSHKKEDKPACRIIAEYFSNAGIDYFLDEKESDLQIAVASGNPHLITEKIKEGINKSSHMLVVVSKKTLKSQWVPFEVGYGHAAIIDKSMSSKQREDIIKLSILTLKDISEADLPIFMQVGNIIRGTKSINQYISKITKRNELELINESKIYSHSRVNHSLDNILNWKL